ncbi:MAG: exodeoxyribonuclease VII large subunit [Tannerella sp.]|jgi:exodeoxyribonuclease VII large subunit|nr:exodeoxyribonuclease VII large subunit [Tannerella sp.]
MRLFNNMESRDNPMTLSELNEQVQLAVHASFPETYWVRAETSDVRVNASSGHCYLEFVEKDAHTGQIVAKARGTIWSRTWYTLKTPFENITGQSFASGLKVMVNISVEFHKLYGYSLTVIDIDPSYTLGDLVRKKQEIILRLKAEGVFELNRELPFPDLPQHIAVITSPTAAGYEDFVNQLLYNQPGYPFLIKLFPAVMQGEKTEESVIAALDRVAQYAELFDVVVLIRGGGSAADLNCFDSYPLAAHCAQFPLPLITGIGHERDDSIVDMVAHTRMKTPTAVAAFLIGKRDEQAGELNRLQQHICAGVTEILARHKTNLKLLATRFPASVTHLIEWNGMLLTAAGNRLSATHLLIQKQQLFLTGMKQQLQHLSESFIKDKNEELELTEQFLKLVSLDYSLKRGYVLTLKDGKIVRHAAGLAAGDTITIRYADGERTAVIQ